MWCNRKMKKQAEGLEGRSVFFVNASYLFLVCFRGGRRRFIPLKKQPRPIVIVVFVSIGRTFDFPPYFHRLKKLTTFLNWKKSMTTFPSWKSRLEEMPRRRPVVCPLAWTRRPWRQPCKDKIRLKTATKRNHARPCKSWDCVPSRVCCASR